MEEVLGLKPRPTILNRHAGERPRILSLPLRFYSGEKPVSSRESNSCEIATLAACGEILSGPNGPLTVALR